MSKIMPVDLYYVIKTKSHFIKTYEKLNRDNYNLVVTRNIDEAHRFYSVASAKDLLVGMLVLAVSGEIYVVKLEPYEG